jgi:hypothetical protein
MNVFYRSAIVFFTVTMLSSCVQSAGSSWTVKPILNTPSPETLNEQIPVHTATIEDPDNITPTPNQSNFVVSPMPTTGLPYVYVLSPEQREMLNQAAQKYVAANQEETKLVAQQLNYIGKNATPNTMCGPLAIAILQDAGIVDPEIPRIDFYYFNPRPGFAGDTIESAFPESRFKKIEQNLPINEIDYSVNPLHPGDFLYLFAGDSGSFEHMLTVSRVDELGRAFAVTNYNTPEGVAIQEVMLYDPNQPGIGKFYDWTNWANRELGRTGYGGFWLWRSITPPEIMDDTTLQLGQDIDKIIDDIGGDWHVQIKEIVGSVLYQRLSNTHLNPASFIKLADAILFLKMIDQEEVNDINGYLSRYGVGNRSFDQLLRAMLIKSEEDATALIEDYISSSGSPNQRIHDLGFTQTFISPRQTTVSEISRMLEMLYCGDLLEPETTAYLLSLLSTITDAENVRTGIIRNKLEKNENFYYERGSSVAGQMIVADLSLFEHEKKAYILAFYTNLDNDISVGYEELETGIEQITLVFWDYLSDR